VLSRRPSTKDEDEEGKHHCSKSCFKRRQQATKANGLEITEAEGSVRQGRYVERE
jgi:hypothetical protein